MHGPLSALSSIRLSVSVEAAEKMHHSRRTRTWATRTSHVVAFCFQDAGYLWTSHQERVLRHPGPGGDASGADSGPGRAQPGAHHVHDQRLREFFSKHCVSDLTVGL